MTTVPDPPPPDAVDAVDAVAPVGPVGPVGAASPAGRAPNEIPVEPALPELLPDLRVAHVGAHDVEPPHGLTPVDRFDAWVDGHFDRLRGTEPADRIFYAITELADFSLLWLLLAAGKAALDDDEVPNAVRVAAVLVTESFLVNAGIKSVFRRERPVADFERPYKLRVPLTTSFPSGHSSAAAVAATLLAENSRAKPLYWVMAALVASSRVYVRIHHASDVLGGFGLGIALGAGAKRAWPLDQGPIGTRRVRRRLRRR
jgi:undecaprenyl-diphosphatase